MSQNNLNINNDYLFLISILNTMYNDNLRQINNLTNSNTEIRNHIVSLLNPQNNRRTNSNRWRNYNHRNNLHTQPSQNTTPIILDFILPPSTSTTSTTASNNPLSRIIQRFFEPIEVYPTPSQIEAATRMVRYSDIVSPKNIACPISLENFNDSETVSVIRFCGHIFNREQLNTWFQSRCICPICRYDIRNYNPTNPTNPTTSETVEPTEDLHNTQPSNRSSQSNTERSNTDLNNIYYTMLSPGSEGLINLLLDSSGNYISESTNTILNNYQRRFFR
jgi:hypothetical protein